jgi:Putative prokaryotic signal transducing protein
MDTKDDGLTTLATAASEFEALMLVNALDDRGITARAAGTFASQFRAEAPGPVHVLVKSSDLAAARSVVEEVRNQPLPAAEEEGAWVYRPQFIRRVIWTFFVLQLLATAVSVRIWLSGDDPSLDVSGFSFDFVAGLVISTAVTGLVAFWRR